MAEFVVTCHTLSRNEPNCVTQPLYDGSCRVRGERQYCKPIESSSVVPTLEILSGYVRMN